MLVLTHLSKYIVNNRKKLKKSKYPLFYLSFINDIKIGVECYVNGKNYRHTYIYTGTKTYSYDKQIGSYIFDIYVALCPNPIYRYIKFRDEITFNMYKYNSKDADDYSYQYKINHEKITEYTKIKHDIAGCSWYHYVYNYIQNIINSIRIERYNKYLKKIFLQYDNGILAKIIINNKNRDTIYTI